MKKKSDSSEKISRLLIVGNCPLIVDALSRAIDVESDLSVCGVAEDVDLAVEAIKVLEPDMMIVDMALPMTDVLGLIKNVSTMSPDLATLVLSLCDRPMQAANALRAGAKGVIIKKEKIQKVLEAIREVLKGQPWISEEMMPDVFQNFIAIEKVGAEARKALTKRELEIFEMIGRGLSTEKIAKQLFVSQRTVESHRDHIKKKLNIEDMISLHKMAFQLVQSELVEKST